MTNTAKEAIDGNAPPFEGKLGQSGASRAVFPSPRDGD